MPEIEDEGLFLIEGDEVTPIHSSDGEQNLGALNDYIMEWFVDND